MIKRGQFQLLICHPRALLASHSCFAVNETTYPKKELQIANRPSFLTLFSSIVTSIPFFRQLFSFGSLICFFRALIRHLAEKSAIDHCRPPFEKQCFTCP